MRIVLIIFALQVAVLAAPSENPKQTKTDFQEQMLNEGQDTDGSKHSQRHKRWYNYYGYGFPPVSPIVYPTNKRDNAQETGSYSTQDEPFMQIYTRLQEIAQYVRQPSYAPAPPSQIPLFFPVIFIPQIGCHCTPTQEVAPTPTINETSFVIENRLPPMEDSRQNWGFIVNNTDPDPNETDYVDDSIRPVDFIPVTTNTSTSRPPPPVEHGSSQAGSSSEPANQGREVPVLSAPSTTVNPFEKTTVSPPTACDGAILSCCHQVQPTYECFTNQGCQNPTEFSDPCNVETIKLVIDRFQKYYNRGS